MSQNLLPPSSNAGRNVFFCFKCYVLSFLQNNQTHQTTSAQGATMGYRSIEDAQHLPTNQNDS